MANNSLKSYFGYWSIPCSLGECVECPGILYLYDNDGLILDIHHSEQVGHEINLRDSYDIIQGKDDNEHSITLENVVFRSITGYVHTTLHARFALIGGRLSSFDVKAFSLASIHYPNLRTWAFCDRVNISFPNHDTDVYTIDMSKKKGTILSSSLDDMDLALWSSINTHCTQYDYTFVQDTYLNLISRSLSSANDFLRNITIFSRFLSISLYRTQSPDIITLYDEQKNKYELLYKPFASSNVRFSSVVKFEKLKDRLPEIIAQWYKNYDKVSPIAAYLSDSLSSNSSFDSPDFLLIVQALDGYFKRFQNKKDGKDTQKNKDALIKLINHFDNISAIKECQLDAEVIVQTRDYYTHLLEETAKPKAITKSRDLIWLTEKCKILLTCCLLEYSGMTMEEINECCESSPIKTSLHWISMHEEKNSRTNSL